MLLPLPLFGVAILLLSSCWLNYVFIHMCMCLCAWEYSGSSNSDNGNKPRSSARNDINRIRFKSPFSFEIDSGYTAVHKTLPFDLDGYTFVYLSMRQCTKTLLIDLGWTKWTPATTNIYNTVSLSNMHFKFGNICRSKENHQKNKQIPLPISCNSYCSSATIKLIIN